MFERELWRIAVEYLFPDEQHAWAALAGARVAANGWRRAKTTIHHDAGGELRRRFLLSCIQRNRNAQLRQRALAEIAVRRDPEGFDLAVDIIGTWSREERREGSRILLQALAERRIGRRDQAQAWLWRLAEYSRDAHEEYAVQRWPETKRLLGLLVNSSGPAHGRNARRLVHAARKHDRRLAAALLASAVATRPRRRRCCAVPATGWRASPPRWRASWCATSRRASAAASSAAAAPTRPCCSKAAKTAPPRRRRPRPAQTGRAGGQGHGRKRRRRDRRRRRGPRSGLGRSGETAGESRRADPYAINTTPDQTNS